MSHEILSTSAAEALKTRAHRASQLLSHPSVKPEIWEASIVAHVIYELTKELNVRGVGRLMYGSRTLAMSDAVKNLQAVASAPIGGAVVSSAVALIQAAREIETACRRLASVKLEG